MLEIHLVVLGARSDTMILGARASQGAAELIAADAGQRGRLPVEVVTLQVPDFEEEARQPEGRLAEIVAGLRAMLAGRIEHTNNGGVVTVEMREQFNALAGQLNPAYAEAGRAATALQCIGDAYIRVLLDLDS